MLPYREFWRLYLQNISLQSMENFPGVWNTERALKQIAILINEDRWVSDQEIDCMI